MFDAHNTDTAAASNAADSAVNPVSQGAATAAAGRSKNAPAGRKAGASGKAESAAGATPGTAEATSATTAATTTAPAARRPAGIEPDAEMDRLVADAEKSWKREAEVQLVDLLDAYSRGVLTLFPYVPRTVEAGKVYPAMTGHLDTRRVKVRVSAFAKRTDEGREFLSLAIGAQGQDHIGGAVFRSEEQDETDGQWRLAPGKENERHGVISKTVRIDGTDTFETVFELRFYGRRRLTSAGVPYIKAQVYQARRSDAQANGDDDKAMDGCF